MADEIETAAQLIDLAVLRQIAIHELAANRAMPSDTYEGDLPPEELHAPDSPDDDAALDVSARLEDHCLGVRCRLETSNAYGNFVVDGEAIFDLPAPVSSRQPNIVDEFTEQVGVPVLFPYIRTAVATLAAQLSVPASPLPLLHVGAVALTHDDEPAIEQKPAELFMHGTVTRTTDDGDQEHVAEFFVDEETGLLTRIGGEGQTPDTDVLLNAWAELPRPDEVTWEWLIRRSGESQVRESIEALREANGDDATNLALAEIDAAAAHISAEDAFLALNAAVENLDDAIAAARNAVGDRKNFGGTEGISVPIALLEAAERVRDGWARMTHATPS